MILRISLTQGKYAIADIEDAALVVPYRWYAVKFKTANTWYAMRRAPRNPITGKQKPIMMHRVIVNAPAGVEVDHIDGDGLNNRRANLRLANKSQNQHNQTRRHKRNTSGLKGVSFHKATGKWQATIRFNGKQIYLGLFPDDKAAGAAYDIAAKELFGEFAATNSAGEAESRG